MASRSGNGVDPSGWLVVDPSGQPYSWYGFDLASDDQAAWHKFESDAGLRAQLAAAGWTIRAGSGVELALGHNRGVSVRVSA
ncbi:hypothetical protein A5658_04810 [Mycobacterium sp. 1245111.1]|uniref:hypothetical protein n=1 Tax=Mycobacterium sp. 1245111.1 TaxID=1834073 RepID=UPI0007FCAE4F|nr:hypothetical protein [Mycobacterium sp. 1245111.1]OBK36983.1 hypothetical protein A5658_04810 [Mycobacterium sp. 1245111.1]